jgi:hypothetical protein
LISSGTTRPDAHVIYVHTEGTPGIFAYGDKIEAMLASRIAWNFANF